MTLHLNHLHAIEDPDVDLRCRHLAVSYTAFCTDRQQWLDEGISDLLGLFLLGARS